MKTNLVTYDRLFPIPNLLATFEGAFKKIFWSLSIDYL